MAASFAGGGTGATDDSRTLDSLTLVAGATCDSGWAGGRVASRVDEVIVFDPYFVMYPHFITMAGGKSVLIDTYPDFRISLAKVKAALTHKTKAIIINSPANPTGVVHDKDTLRVVATARLAAACAVDA